VLWTLFEYLLHRWGFHHRRESLVLALVAREHRMHHREPLRTSLLLRTLAWLAVVAPTAPLAVLWGAPGAGLVLGWALGYTAYDRFHWRSHHRHGRSRYETWLRARHNVHHYGNPHHNYGVTSDIWDRVLRTGIPADRP